MRTSVSLQFTAWATAMLVSAVVLSPLLWALITSLKMETMAVSFPPSFWPSPATLTNYLSVIRHATFASDLINSFAYAIGAVVLALLVAVPAGYAAARLHFAAKRLLMLAILATSMVPGVALLIPTYILLDRLGLLSNMAVLIVILAARLAPQSVWFIENFIEAVPVEIEEAAFVDGAQRSQILLRLVLPLIKPGIAAVAVLGFVTTWNDYVTVAVFAPDIASRTLQVTLVNQVFDAIGISWSFFMAYAIVASLPVVIVFMVAQRWFVAGLTSGTVKG
jgi:ABC-type glycerol-3-phosphate transport system permease component